MVPALKRRFRKTITTATVAAVVILAISVLVWSDRRVASTAAPFLYDSVDALPKNTVGVVLGCAPYLPGGRNNLYFTHRIAAAAELFELGKVEYLLVSGDNSTRFYNEPSQMRTALIEAGIPDERIVLDYAGFRTLDSMVRANKVFGLDHFTIISQRFHNERAVYIAHHFGARPVAFNARDVPGPAGAKTRFREVFARFKTLLDVHLFDTPPRYLGERIEIGG